MPVLFTLSSAKSPRPPQCNPQESPSPNAAAPGEGDFMLPILIHFVKQNSGI